MNGLFFSDATQVGPQVIFLFCERYFEEKKMRSTNREGRREEGREEGNELLGRVGV